VIKEPNKVRNALVNALVIGVVFLFVVILVIGFYQFGRWVVDVLSHTRMPALGVPDWVLDLFTEQERGKPRHLSAERTGELTTGMFTIVLCYVTWTMGRASRRQVAGDAPLLNIKLFVAATPQTGQPVPATAPLKREVREREVYPSELVRADERVFKGNKFNPLTPARMLKVRIDNVQTRPFAVARDIKITIELTFVDPHQVVDEDEPMSAAMVATLAADGDVDSPAPGVRKVRRDVQVRILAPDNAVTEPIFNLAALTECEVAVSDVTYYELRRKTERKAAYGDLFLTVKGDGTVEAKDGYYRPRGWEMP
jgi:Na+-transporting methylmalonyl-CoA/oxaloacetate decarboxylase gamma subunit